MDKRGGEVRFRTACKDMAVRKDQLEAACRELGYPILPGKNRGTRYITIPEFMEPIPDAGIKPPADKGKRPGEWLAALSKSVESEEGK